MKYRGRPGVWASGAVVTIAVACAGDAAAQVAHVKTDVAVEVGSSERFTTDRAAHVGLPTPGLYVGVRGHVALLPMVRVGAYAELETSKGDEPSTRVLFGGGLRAKITPPLPLFASHPGDAVHAWFFVGIGYMRVEDGGYTFTGVPAVGSALGPPATLPSVPVPAMHGGFFEVPVGLGLGWRFRRPYELIVELSGRRAFFRDEDEPRSTYTPPQAATGQGGFAFGVPGAGLDAWAVTLTVGLGLDLP